MQELLPKITVVIPEDLGKSKQGYITGSTNPLSLMKAWMACDDWAVDYPGATAYGLLAPGVCNQALTANDMATVCRDLVSGFKM